MFRNLVLVCGLIAEGFAKSHHGKHHGIRQDRTGNHSKYPVQRPFSQAQFREVYLEEACGGVTARSQRSHYLSLHDNKATMMVHSHRGKLLPRVVRKCRIQIQTESHARLTLSFSQLDTVEQSFVCYMYLKLFMTDKADLVCGKEASGKSISTFGSQMAMEWVINSGGEKPGRISMIITSFKDTDLSGNCENNMYACNNRRCIWRGFVCDSVDNCGDGSDERLCIGGRQDHTLILAFVILVILFGVGIGIVIRIIFNRRGSQTQYIIGTDLSQVNVTQGPKPYP